MSCAKTGHMLLSFVFQLRPKHAYRPL